jgi:translation initiation factor 2 alpha subunit (eIF-2alpha)
MVELEVGDVVMCTVERIVGTTVFVKIDGDGEGSIILSEIAPGRIRNLRDYVVPKKVIICKVLRLSGGRIDLSLRRVTPKEQKEVKERYKFEKSYSSILETILGEKSKQSIEEINKTTTVYNFLEEAKDSPKELEKLVGVEKAKKIIEILKSQKKKKVSIKKEFLLSSAKPNGVELIKEIAGSQKKVEIKYIAAGRYSIKSEAPNPKSAEQAINEVLSEIEKAAKKAGVDFSVK